MGLDRADMLTVFHPAGLGVTPIEQFFYCLNAPYVAVKP